MTVRVSKLRLSPDGPFWGNESGGQTAPVGPGTPGLVFHAKLAANTNMTGAAVLLSWDDAGPTPTQVLPWTLRRTFFYELILDLEFTLPAAPAGALTVDVTAEDTSGVEQTVASSSDIVLPDETEEWPCRFARVAIDGTAWATDREDVRVRLTADASAIAIAGLTNIVLTQYVP